jgi:hypothetical protein
MKLSPLVKGLITGIAMVIYSLIAYNYIPKESLLHWLVWGIYAVGIIWTLISWKNSDAYTGKFGDGFNTGFRCFIVAALIMVVFTFVFNKMHPELAGQYAKAYKEQLMKQKEKLQTDIDKEVENVRKNYNTVVLYGSIFGYLIIGAAVTAAASALLSRRKN